MRLLNKVIAIDFDSVLNNLLDEWIRYLNQCYHIGKTIEDIKYWDMTKNYPELTEMEIYSPLQDPLFWDTIELLPNVIKTLKEMKAEGYRIVIVTDSDYRILKFKWDRCLLKLLEGIITPKDIIVTSQKDLIKCDYIIDDYENNLKNSSGIRLLISYPYNLNASEDTYDYRCKDISEAWETILYIEEIERVKEMRLKCTQYV